jgi:formate--tetrahydrofolate ligase
MLAAPDTEAVRKGLANLEKHIENIRRYGLPLVVALNRFPTDSDPEIDVVKEACSHWMVPFALSQVWRDGGQGGIELAGQVIKAAESPADFKYLYPLNLPVTEKIDAIAHQIYGASGVDYLAPAMKSLEQVEAMGYGHLPVCVAKTQYSLTDDPKLLGRPRDFKVTVRDLKVSAGAQFIVAFMGNIVTMPGLSRTPAAHEIDIDEQGCIFGLF